MFVHSLLFYSFSSASVILSLVMIISKNPVYSILSLILVFLNVSGLFVTLGAEFLALLFIIVYVGAVAVLFLFVIMMLNIKFLSIRLSIYRYIPIFLIFGLIFSSEFLLIFCNDLVYFDIQYLDMLHLNEHFLDWCVYVFLPSNLTIFSDLLYTHFVFLLIASGIILLISMIGAISLTLHRRNDIKRQHIYKQLSRDFKDAITWIK